MAIAEGNESLTLVKSDRTWRIELFMDDADVVQLRFRRERLFTLNGVIQHRTPLTDVVRTQAQVAAKAYTAGGVTRTGNQILALISQMSDDERAIDVANGVKP
jgi:hypothetical protein